MALFAEGGAKLDLFPRAPFLNDLILDRLFVPVARAFGFRAEYPEGRPKQSHGSSKPATS